MITKKDFETEVYKALDNEKPEQWRSGQFVFNYIDHNYGDVARISQFKYGVDCFYDDNKIQDFIDCCYKIISNKDEND